MSAFHGRQHKGAQRDRRLEKRADAVRRNQLTLIDRRSKKRLAAKAAARNGSTS